MAKRPSLTKSPLALARQAMAIAQKALSPYSDLKSRHDFTQAQLFTILTLRQFFKTDYRGIVKILEDSSDIQEALGLNKLPHYTTLQKAQQRLLKKTSGKASWEEFSIRHDLSD